MPPTRMGTLFVCPTPIGNLEDITLRVLRTLADVDLIAAEDTRKTRKLLTHYSIKTRLLSYHEHNALARRRQLLSQLEAGASIALVSEAGTPGLSDPGYPLIRACLEAGVPVDVLPGPTAAITALVASGLPTDSFVFQGFLPRKKGERRRLLEELKDEHRTLIFYEAPHRIKRLLVEIMETLGDRPAAMARELSKRFQEISRGSVQELIGKMAEKEPRGEIVLVVGAAETSIMKPEPDALKERVLQLMNSGISKKDAIGQVAETAKISRRTVYEAVKHVKVTSHEER